MLTGRLALVTGNFKECVPISIEKKVLFAVFICLRDVCTHSLVEYW